MAHTGVEPRRHELIWLGDAVREISAEMRMCLETNVGPRVPEDKRGNSCFTPGVSDQPAIIVTTLQA